MGAIRHYFWMRPDNTMSGAGKAIHTKMDEFSKRAIMNTFKDSFEVGRMELRSTEMVNEMRSVVNEEGSIGASGRAKDDRVIAAALAHWVWIQQVKSQLTGQRMTFAAVRNQEENSMTTMGQMNRQVFQYLRHSGIKVQ